MADRCALVAGIVPMAVLCIGFFLVHTGGISWSLLEKVELGTVVASLIAVSGYVVDHRNNRDAEMRSSQIERATTQMSVLLVPLNVGFHSLISSLGFFLEAYGNFPRGRGSDPFDRSIGKWMWDLEDGLMKVSKAGGRSTMCRFELPPQLEAAIMKDTTSSLAVAYRNWIRHTWVPGVARISEAIDNGCHLMEPVPAKKLEDMFGPVSPFGGAWSLTPRGIFFSLWISYSRGWGAVLAQWDEGDFSRMRPLEAFPVGIFWTVLEGQNLVGEVQKELTGQSQMHGWVRSKQ